MSKIDGPFMALSRRWRTDDGFLGLSLNARGAWLTLALHTEDTGSLHVSRVALGHVLGLRPSQKHEELGYFRELVAAGMAVITADGVELVARHQTGQASRAHAERSANPMAMHGQSNGTALAMHGQCVATAPIKSSDESAPKNRTEQNRTEQSERRGFSNSKAPSQASLGTPEALPAVAVKAPKSPKPKRPKTKMPMVDLETSDGWLAAFAWAREQNINPNHPGFRRFFATRMASLETSAAWIVNFRVSGWATNDTSGQPKSWNEYLAEHPEERAASAAAEQPQGTLFESLTTPDAMHAKGDVLSPVAAERSPEPEPAAEADWDRFEALKPIAINQQPNLVEVAS